VLEGRNLREIRELFARRLQDARSELGELRRRAFELGAQALRPDAKAVEVVIEGQAQLFDKPEFADVDRIKSLVRLLEERERLVAILDKTLETRGVRVVLPGEPASDELGEQLSLVSARYAAGSDVPAGTVGVLGPTRMDYASIVPLVSETALAVSAFLGKRDGGS
jgi:heat-inducible transcriptional repressor